MMTTRPTVLLLGATGRTGGRVLRSLLAREVPVKAVVRSAARLPEDVAADPRLVVIEAGIHEMSEAALVSHLAGCEVVISCLGHNVNVRDVFGPPRDLVSSAVDRICRAAESLRPDRPVRFILMSSVSVERPGRMDTRRKAPERAMVALLRALVPPARDNQHASDILCGADGRSPGCVEWVVVRPDSLREGEATPYALHEGLVTSLARPGETNMANIAEFMSELATDDATWDRFKGSWPVIVNAA